MEKHSFVISNVVSKGSVFSFSGGFLIGWSIGSVLAGGDFNLPLTMAGAGLTGISVPFQTSYNRYSYKVVSIYNSALNELGSRNWEGIWF